MNRINPLHIGALLVVILFYMIFELADAKSALLEAKANFNSTSKLAVELHELQRVYHNKSKTKRAILRILDASILRDAQIKKRIKNSSITITAASINKKVLNYLMGKILNNSFVIQSIKIKKLSDKKSELEVKILW